MRRFLASLLLICFGVMTPLAVSPLRYCLLEGKLLMPGFKTYGETATHKDKCCPDCGTHGKGDSCCHELKKLPDAAQPSGPLVLTPLFCCELNARLVMPPCPVATAPELPAPDVLIRVPDPPGLRRALLGIWNI